MSAELPKEGITFDSPKTDAVHIARLQKSPDSANNSLTDGSIAEKLPRAVWVLTIASFFIALGYGVIIPVLPVFGLHMGATSFQIGLVISSFAAMRLLGAPGSAIILAKIGSRKAISLGMFGVAISSALCTFSENIWQLIIFRGIGGLGSVLSTVATASLVLRSVSPKLRGRASGLQQGGFLCGSLAGPAIGGVMASFSLAAPFLFYSFTLLIAISLCLLFLPKIEPGIVETDPTRKVIPFRVVIKNIGFQAACLCYFAWGWQCLGPRNALIPIMLDTEIHANQMMIGIVFMVVAIVQALFLLPFGFLTDYYSRKGVMIAGCLLVAASSFLIPFSHTFITLTSALCLFSIGGAALGTAPNAAVGDASNGNGKAIAAFSMVTDFGALIGPLVAGYFADQGSVFAAFSIGAVILVLGAGYSAFIPKHQIPKKGVSNA